MSDTSSTRHADTHTVVDNVSPTIAEPNRTVLACIDGSKVTQSVCDYAAWYASKLELSVTLLHVIKAPKSNRHDLSGTIGLDSRRVLLQELAQLDKKTSRIALKHGEALISDAKTHIIADYDTLEVKTHQRHGDLLTAIEHFAKQTQVIVMGRRGEDHQRKASKSSGQDQVNQDQVNQAQVNQAQVNIGSQIETVVRAMHKPILICSDDFTPPSSYLLAYDGSPTANKAVQMICDSDLSRGSKGYLVMVGHQDSKHETYLYKAKDKLSKAGLDVEVAILDTASYGKDVVKALIKYRTEHDISMFIVGAYGHSKLRRLFVGSTTTKLLANTIAPVLLLR